MQKFTPRQYLKIDIANAFGLDKLTWDQRLEWFDTNEAMLLSKLSEAENPAMFYAGLKAWEDVKAGKASGYPISLDATSSGIQILSVLTGDKSAAMLSNVICNPENKRSNAYQALYESMLALVGGKMEYSYNDLKRSIMTAFYGSEAVPKEVFGEGRMLGAFFQTLEKEAPYVWELNKAFLAMWNPEALKYSWVLPDNFHVNIKIMNTVEEDITFAGETVTVYHKENKPSPTGRSLGANVTHSIDGFIVRELMRRCSYKREQTDRIQALIRNGNEEMPEKVIEDHNYAMVVELWELYGESGYLSARILDYLDENNVHYVNIDPIQDMLDSMPEKPFTIIAVHDCFRTHPNYGNDLRKQYNLQLSLIAQSDMLSFLLTQVMGKQVKINKQADFSSEILNANYALS